MLRSHTFLKKIKSHGRISKRWERSIELLNLSQNTVVAVVGGIEKKIQPIQDHLSLEIGVSASARL